MALFAPCSTPNALRSFSRPIGDPPAGSISRPAVMVSARRSKEPFRPGSVSESAAIRRQKAMVLEVTADGHV
eukprot:COSAG06_NODE_3307_length_5528_cov_105.042918_3_plen_72_part_00